MTYRAPPSAKPPNLLSNCSDGLGLLGERSGSSRGSRTTDKVSGSGRAVAALRSWREDTNVTRGGCYARARGWDPSLPDLEASRLLDDDVRSLDSQKARVVVGLAGVAEAPSIGGFVIAIVGDVRRCLLIAYETEAEGPAAEGKIADRLAIVAERLLPGIKLDPSFTPTRERAIGSRPGPPGAR